MTYPWKKGDGFKICISGKKTTKHLMHHSFWRSRWHTCARAKCRLQGFGKRTILACLIKSDLHMAYMKLRLYDIEWVIIWSDLNHIAHAYGNPIWVFFYRKHLQYAISKWVVLQWKQGLFLWVIHSRGRDSGIKFLLISLKLTVFPRHNIGSKLGLSDPVLQLYLNGNWRYVHEVVHLNRGDNRHVRAT